MWQNLIVAVIAIAAVLHFSTKYLPLAWRKRLSAALSRRGAAGAKMGAWWYQPAAAGGGCGDGCSTCGSCDDAGAPAADDPRIIKLHPHPHPHPRA
jgi:hypothetical protein